MANTQKGEEDITSTSEPRKFRAQSLEQFRKNQLCLRISIEAVLCLATHDLAYSGDGETSEERNQHISQKLLQSAAEVIDEFANIMIQNASYLSNCTSYQFQRKILQFYSNKVKNHIRDEIGDSKFCIVLGGARGPSDKDQMALILRFVDKKGFIKERFFDIVHVKDTTALVLKEEVCAVLSRHNLDVSNLRGQGYDGTCDNMRKEWNGLQELFLNECPYAYHIHCFTHNLQHAFVCALSEVYEIQQFFSKFTSSVKFFCSCSKPDDTFLADMLDQIANLIELDGLGTTERANRIRTSQQYDITRSRSHFSSFCSLINRYDAACSLLEKLSDDGSSYCQSGDAYIAYNNLTTFEFVFVLHLMRDIMRITDSLCQALQQIHPNLVNVKLLVRSTKAMLQNLRHYGWDTLLKDLTRFCEKNKIKIPQFNASYVPRSLRSDQQKDHITVEHYYREVFFIAVDKQLHELNSRFGDQALELLTLSFALVPKKTGKAFNIDHICTLVEKNYPMDFNEQEMISLQFQLQHFNTYACQDSNLKNLSTVEELCRSLVVTKKSEVYCLIDRLLRLIMTLPVYRATTERSFSAMEVFKTKLRNKPEDEFLADSMILYMEKEITYSFGYHSNIDDLYLESLKELNNTQLHSSAKEEPDGSHSLPLQVTEDKVEDAII